MSCLRRNRRHADMSVACRREVTSDEIVASQDFALAFRLRLACANDAELLCANTRLDAFDEGFDYDAAEYKEGADDAAGAGAAGADDEPRDGGATLQCLGDKMEEIKRKACRAEVFAYLKDVNVDLRIDGPLVEACAGEIGEGGACGPPAYASNKTVLACLRDEAKAAQLTDACHEKVFHRQKLEASDARLNVGVDENCKTELSAFCSKVEPGGGRLEQCLYLAMTKPDGAGAAADATAAPFGEACKASVLALKREQSSDIRLKPLVWKACKASIESYCPAKPDDGTDWGPDGDHSSVLDCLATKATDESFVASGKKGAKKCGKVVHQMVMEWARDFQLSPLLKRACKGDAERLCEAWRGGHRQGEIFDCLRDNRDEFESSLCEDAFQHSERLRSASIDFKPKFRSACSAELSRDGGVCAGPTAQAAAAAEGDGGGTAKAAADFDPITCLRDARADAASAGKVSDGCKAEVAKDEARAAAHYRVSFRLRTACAGDVAKLCSEEKSWESASDQDKGDVLSCLQAHKLEDKLEPGCAKEVFRFERDAGNDVRVDPKLFGACRIDILERCLGGGGGDGGGAAAHALGDGSVLQCLTSLAGLGGGADAAAAAADDDNGNKAEDATRASADLSGACYKEVLRHQVAESKDVRINKQPVNVLQNTFF